MDHVAIMRKSWNLIPKILDGRKKIESRWGVNKVAPWGKVKVGDRVYFKNSGEPIVAVAQVSKVRELENLSPQKIKEILEEYGSDGDISISNFEEMSNWAKNKRYCTLIYLVNPRKIKPFNIDKTGFGSASAWLTTENVTNISVSLKVA